MTDFSPRTYLRDKCGPRAIDAGRDSTRTSRYTRDDDDSKHKNRKPTDKRSKSKHEPSRQKSTVSRSLEKPSFRLDIINQPSKHIPLGAEISSSILVSLMFPTAEAAQKKVNLDTTKLIGVVSLAAETSSGDRVPMDAGSIVADQLVSSLHHVPQAFADRLMQSQPCRLPLGYMTFSDLLIRQSGQCRLRVALLGVSSSGQNPSTIAVLDSELIRVERRIANNSSTRQQR